MHSEQTSFSAVLGVLLANLRKEKSIEQGDMAERMGLSQASFSRLESGKSSFSVDQMFQAAKALDITNEDLFERLTKTINIIENNDVSVKPQLRGSTAKAKQQGDGIGVGTLVAGAALGALLVGLLSKK